MSRYSVFHPLNERMDNYPIVFCHPETFSEARDVVPSSGAPASGRLVRHNQQQRWLSLANQTPAQTLVHRVASSNPDDPIGGKTLKNAFQYFIEGC
jgi:hypothetical protein